VLADRTRRFDKQGEQFYDQISALHKSVRSSNPDAALYWLARMLDGGVDPIYLARRLTRMAVEDIGRGAYAIFKAGKEFKGDRLAGVQADSGDFKDAVDGCLALDHGSGIQPFLQFFMFLRQRIIFSFQFANLIE